VEKYGRASQATDDNMIRRMSIACWILKATYIHSELVKRIAFPRQGCLLYRTAFLCIYDCVLKTFPFRGVYDVCAKSYAGLYVNEPAPCPVLTKFGIKRQILTKLRTIKSHEYPLISLSCADRRTEKILPWRS